MSSGLELGIKDDADSPPDITLTEKTDVLKGLSELCSTCILLSVVHNHGSQLQGLELTELQLLDLWGFLCFLDPSLQELSPDVALHRSHDNYMVWKAPPLKEPPWVHGQGWLTRC